MELAQRSDDFAGMICAAMSLPRLEAYRAEVASNSRLRFT
jgi:hypothetical protein